MNRRSFLGLVAAAIAVRPQSLLAEPNLQPGDKIPFRIVPPSPTDVWTPFAISDSILVHPKETLDASLFRLPQPEMFLLNNLNLTIGNHETTVQNVRKVLDGCWLDLKKSNLVMVEAGMYSFPVFSFLSGGTQSLWRSIACDANEPLRVGLHSARPLKITEPVTVRVTLQGHVRVKRG